MDRVGPVLRVGASNAESALFADYQGLPKPTTSTKRRAAFAQNNPQAIRAVIEQLRAGGAWVTRHPAETAALLAPKVGLDAAIVEKWVRRVPYAATPVGERIVATQQSVAERVLSRAKLIPRPIAVKDSVWRGETAARTRFGKLTHSGGGCPRTPAAAGSMYWPRTAPTRSRCGSSADFPQGHRASPA